ncbi:MAG: sulfatase [Planctomycetales bacterium]|nr:sulfatase [Planctomycetales bacterium]
MRVTSTTAVSWFVLAMGLASPWTTWAEETPRPAEQSSRRPNILMVMIDDLGWMDLSCQGNRAVHTPHLDQLAREGMRFTDAYAAAPVCSPTRAAVVTGQAPARLRITNHTPDRPSFTPDNPRLLPAPMHDQLELKAVTIAELLSAGGYDTAFFGKWHLSGPGRGRTELEPTAQGFGLNLGGCGFGGPPTFFDPYKIPNLPPRKTGEYLPDRLADEAIRFIREPRERPFMVFLWNYTVHWPMEAPEPLLDKYRGHRGPGLNDYRYGAMIEAMDASIGSVLKALDELGQRNETLVVFTSDNGGFSGVADNRPLRDGKGDLYEGGIRVPLILRWPGKVAAGVECRNPVISMDFFPTFAHAAGCELPKELPLDGLALQPLMATGNVAEDNALARRSLYFHYPNYAWHRSNRLGGAVRQGEWKLIERFDSGQRELFRLSDDLSEQVDLADREPQRAEALAKQLASWRQVVDAAMPRRP